MTEFELFITTLRGMGVRYSATSNLPKEKYQKRITEAGYNITSLACTSVLVGDMEFIFSTGQAIWRTRNGRVFGYGPAGVFMMSIAKSGTITKRSIKMPESPARDYGEELK